MEKLIHDTLVILGLSKNEIRFFQACYELGPTTIQDAAKVAKLERSTAYLIAEELLEKGFLEQDFKQYRKKIIAIDPSVLLRMLASRQRTVRRQEMELEQELPSLLAYYRTSDIRPSVKVFQGKRALQSIWEDVLETKKEILLWTNQKTESLFFTKEFHDKFISERIKKRIPIRALVVNNEPGKNLLEKDAMSLRHSKLLPLKTSFSAETYIYDNKVAILDYKTDIIGIIIESGPIAATQRSIFDMIWQIVSS